MNPKGSSPLVGMVCWWPGTIANIPDGFLLCDGTHGTPDMRNVLAIGARDGFDSGALLGASTHRHAGATTTGNNNQDHEHLLSGISSGPGHDSTNVTDIGGAFQKYGVHTHPYSDNSDIQNSNHTHRVRRRFADTRDSKQLSCESLFVMKT